MNEQPAGGIVADCSGMPTLDLFLVGFDMGRPRQIEHVGSDLWSGYGQVAHWASH